MTKSIVLVSLIVIGIGTLAFARVNTGDLNSDPSAQLAHQAAVPFDGIKEASAAFPVELTQTHRVVASHTTHHQEPGVNQPQAPSRAQRVQSEEERLDKQVVAGGVAGVLGWLLAVSGALAELPILAGAGLMAWGLGVGLLGAALLQVKEAGAAGKVAGSGLLANALGTVLLGASMMGASEAVLGVGVILFLAGWLAVVGGGIAAISK